MKPHTFFRRVFGNIALITAALGGWFLFAGAPAANADCKQPIVYRDWRYREALERREARERAAFYCRRERYSVWCPR